MCKTFRPEAWGHHAGAVGALYGPLHGGANEAVLRMLERIGSVDNIGPFLEGVKNRKEKMFGFGHRCEPAFTGLFHWISVYIVVTGNLLKGIESFRASAYF